MGKERRLTIKLDREWAKANATALIRSRITVETEINKRIIAKYNLKRNDVKNLIKVTSNQENMAIYITMKGGRLRLSKFNPKQKISIRKGKQIRKGISVVINKGKRQLIEKGFQMKLKKNGVTVYRKRKEGKIQNLYGPNISSIVKSTKFMEDVFTLFKLRYADRLAHELQRRGF